MEAAAALDLPFLCGTQRVHLESAPAVSPAAAGIRVLWLGGIPARAPLVSRRTVRSIRPGAVRQSDRQRGLVAPDVLAKRIQPDSWTISFYVVCRGYQLTRIADAGDLLARRSRRPPVLGE